LSTTTDTVLRVSKIVAAPQDEVFDAWITPSIMSKWSAPEGVGRIECKVDLMVGGEYEIKMINDEGRVHTAHGVYREISRPSKLIYTWDWREDDIRMDTATLVTVEFVAMDGATEVIVTHEQFPNLEIRDGHLQGWTSSINRLAGLFE